MDHKPLFKKRKTGIAFGGGATRGFAHIGVIKVLQENNLDFDLVAGNSIGSVAGALYAAGFSWQEIYAMAKKITAADVLGLNLKRKGLFRSAKLEILLKHYIGSKTFESLNKPFRCVAVNLYNGELIEFSHGSVARAVRASCSVPGIFSPTPIDDLLLVDGGILNSVPGDVLERMGATFSVAINLNSDRGQLTPPKSGFDVLWSALKIAWNENTVQRLRHVNVVIAPDLKDYTYYDLKHIDKMVKIGETAALQKLQEMKKGF
jgi:NTE family protein